MLIIWGFKNFKKVMGMTNEICPVCKNSTIWYIRVRNWFTFCFIPLFPVRTEYYKFCENCGNSWQMTEQQFYQDLNYCNNLVNSMPDNKIDQLEDNFVTPTENPNQQNVAPDIQSQSVDTKEVETKQSTDTKEVNK